MRKTASPTASVVVVVVTLLLFVLILGSALLGGAAFLWIVKVQPVISREVVETTVSGTETVTVDAADVEEWIASETGAISLETLTIENKSLKEQIAKQKKLIELYEARHKELMEALGREPLEPPDKWDL